MREQAGLYSSSWMCHTNARCCVRQCLTHATSGGYSALYQLHLTLYNIFISAHYSVASVSHKVLILHSAERQAGLSSWGAGGVQSESSCSNYTRQKKKTYVFGLWCSY